MTVVPASMLAAAFSLAQIAPPDRDSAERALRAARDAIAAGTSTIDCQPNGHYPEADPCEVQIAGIATLDLRKLVYFSVSRCIVDNRPSRCATLTFDHSRADQSHTDLWFEARAYPVRASADVGSVHVSQGLDTSD